MIPLWAALGKGALILLLALGAHRALAGRAASLRHATWCMVFVALVAAFALPLLGPSLPLPVLPAATSSPVASSASLAVPGAFEAGSSAMSPRRDTAPSGEARLLPPVAALEPPTEVPAGRWGRWLIALSWLWGFGTALLGLRLVAERRLVGRWLRATVSSPAEWEPIVDRCARRVGLGRVPVVRLGAAVPVPMAWGLLRPTVLLPTSARDWSDERLEGVLLHELGHLRRGDQVTAAVTALACALHWPNPLVWRAARLALQDREEACDDLVLRAGADRLSYARLLLDAARGASVSPRRALWATPEMAGPGTLRRRLEALVDPRRSIAAVTVATRRWLVVALAGLLLVACAELADRPAKEAVPDLTPLLTELVDGSTSARLRAAWALGEREAPAAAPALAAVLEDPDARLRGMAAWALGEIKDPASLEPLLAARDDADPVAREMILRAIGEIGDPRALPVLLASADDGDAAVRAVAVWALSDFRGSVEARSAVRTALADAAPAVRAAAVAALGEMGRGGDTVNALIPLLQDDSAALRASSARSLGRLGAASAIDALIGATRDPDPDVRGWAVWALDEINLRR